MRKYHKDGTEPQFERPLDAFVTVFVFGSNLAGVHGAGAAKLAYEKYGAVWGYGVGYSTSMSIWHCQDSYAIPTKDWQIETLPLHTIQRFVTGFIAFAEANPGQIFFVTRIGCGLAGYKDSEIAPMFKDAPENCSFAEEWREYLE